MPDGDVKAQDAIGEVYGLSAGLVARWKSHLDRDVPFWSWIMDKWKVLINGKC